MTEDILFRLGNCAEVMAEMREASIDAIVTDPPYDLTAGKKGGSGVASANLNSPAGRARIGTGNGGGFMGKSWDATGVAFDPDTWRECYRVLKPGGYLLAFGATRTYHRMACAIEDAGFEIRDSIHWIYGSGFPKSLDVGKAIDKAAGKEREVVGQLAQPAGNKPGGASYNMSVIGMPATADLTEPASDAAAMFDGWGTALKPAHEPIIVARKPFTGTVAANVLAAGTGALNVAACTVGTDGGARRGPGDMGEHRENNDVLGKGLDLSNAAPRIKGLGRWPPNLILTHLPDCALADCAGDCPVAEMDEQSGVSKSTGGSRGGNRHLAFGMSAQPDFKPGRGDTGGASRFFPIFKYQAKAPKSERPVVFIDGRKVMHPTVKPLALMRWLVRLVTPLDGVILDPFCGTGTTLQAARDEGFRAIGIDRDPEAELLTRKRLAA